MRLRRLLALVLTSTIATAALAQPPAAPPAPTPTWAYGHDLRARKAGTTDFDKDTPKIGVEFFQDAAAGSVVAVTQEGALAVTANAAISPAKKAPWLFAHDLSSRKGDEDRFTQATTKYGVEAFNDNASGRVLYLTEKGTVAFAEMPATVATNKPPVWHHALIVKVRAAKEQDFAKDTKKFGVEVFKDGNTGGLIYVCETGAIAAAPAPATAPAADSVKAPKALYGLTMRCRKADEADFGADTRTFSVEVFRDENTGGLLYISETGAIAATPASEAKSGQGVAWKYGMALKARPGGVAEFAKAKRFGVEVYQDGNTGNLVYLAETGSIAVLPKK